MGIRHSSYSIAREGQVQGHLERVRHVKQSPIPLHVVFPESASGGGVQGTIISAKTYIQIHFDKHNIRHKGSVFIRTARCSEQMCLAEVRKIRLLWEKCLQQGRKTSILKKVAWRSLAADIILSGIALAGRPSSRSALALSLDERMASGDGTDSEDSAMTLNHVNVPRKLSPAPSQLYSNHRYLYGNISGNGQKRGLQGDPQAVREICLITLVELNNARNLVREMHLTRMRQRNCTISCLPRR
ncbi:hypothetical protein EV421DRAFT_1736086 [Armillaria borealis]|uniref:Uncharacterized protein n=1 Tax=Armillaria borealis TaxID=47425 RepID=A0AA39JGW7_9AGAR|nr:hypothetical protein EV421DRAFT_1736086 [Armillaria borealis]